MPLFGPYYYGKHKWDNYLLDIQETMKSGNVAQRQVVGLQKEVLSELRGQTEQLQHIHDAMNHGFEQLRAEFEWGFSLLADRMDREIEELMQISATLDAIHRIVKSPLLTQAAELFQVGEERYKKGLLDKALEAFLQAEQKNDVDFVLQLQIGKLFLYGRDEFTNIINLPEAERHLLLAARFAIAEKGTVLQWDKYCGQAYFHAAIAAYLLGEEAQIGGDDAKVQACLERAIIYLKQAATLWPAFPEILYTLAKCHALLGQSQEAQNQLEALSDRDRRYFDKAVEDEDFREFHQAVEEVFKRSITSPGPRARAAQARIESLAEALAWAKRAAPEVKEDLATVQFIENQLASARQILPTLHVDIELLSGNLTDMRVQVEKIINCALQKHIKDSEQSVRSIEERTYGYAATIEKLKVTMKNTRAKDAGWTFGLLAFFVGTPVALNLLRPVLPPRLPDWMAGAFSFSVLFASVFVGYFAAAICRSFRNQPYRREIDQLRRAIEECDQEIPSLKERAQQWKQEMNNFLAWQAKRLP
jgi:tetratricopeptide (TPR) repeat protein